MQGTSIPYPAEHEGGDEDEDEDEDLDIDLPPPPPKMQTNIESLEDIMIFLEQHGQIELASKATFLLLELATRHAATLCQKHLTISLIDSFDSLQQCTYL